MDDPLSDIQSVSAPKATVSDPLSEIKSTDTSLPDSYRDASQYKPDDVAKAQQISRQRGIDPNYALANIDSVKKEDGMPNFDALQPSTRKLAQDHMGVAWDSLKNADELASHARTGRQATSLLQAAMAGLEGSGSGYTARWAMSKLGFPDILGKPGLPELTLGDHPSAVNEVVAGVAGMGADLLEFLAGGALGAAALGPTPLAPVGFMAGGFAGQTAFKQAWQEHYTQGDIHSIGDLMRRVTAIAIPTTKSAVVGVATAVAGEAAAVGAAGSAVIKGVSELSAMSATSAAVENKPLTPRDFLVNMGQLLIAHTAGATWDKMSEAAKSSKLRTRAPEAFESHADAASGPAFVPVDKWDSHFGPDSEDMVNKLGVGQSYKAAKASGGDVEIPAGKFLSPEMDSHRDAFTAEDIKSDPGAKTVNQIKEANAGPAEEALPTHAGEGWENDRGAIPGEIASWKGGTGPEDAPMAIVENNPIAGKPRTYSSFVNDASVFNPNAKLHGIADDTFLSMSEASAAAEKQYGESKQSSAKIPPPDPTAINVRVIHHGETAIDSTGEPTPEEKAQGILAEQQTHGPKFAGLGLTDKGKEQVAKVAEDLKDQNIKQTFSGDSKRTKETAGAIKPPTLDGRFGPIDLKGDLDGMPISQYKPILAKALDAWAKDPDSKQLGNESFNEFQARNLAALKDATDKAKPGDTLGISLSSDSVQLFKLIAENGGHPISGNMIKRMAEKENIQPTEVSSYKIDQNGLLVRTDQQQASIGAVRQPSAEEKAMMSRHPEITKDAELLNQIITKEKQPKLDSTIKDITEPLGLKYKGTPKTVKSIVGKVVRKTEADVSDYDALSLKDLARGRITADNWDQAIEIARKLQDEHGFKIESHIDEPLNKFGYRGFQGAADLGDGVRGEIQFHIPEFTKVKDISDDIYREWRTYNDKDIDSWKNNDPEKWTKYHAAMQESNKLWEDYWDKIPEATKAGISDLDNGLESETAPTLSPTGSDQDLPSKTSAGGLEGKKSNLPSESLERSRQSEAAGLSMSSPSNESIPGRSEKVKGVIPQEKSEALRQKFGIGQPPTDISGRKGYVVMGEAIPAPELNHALLNAPIEVKQEFTQRAMPLLNGIANALGIKANIESGTGVFEGSVSPNIIAGIDPSNTPEQVGAFARSVQFAFRQKAVPWAKADENGDFVGVHFAFDQLGEAREASFNKALTEVLTKSTGYTKLGNQIAVVNYGGLPDQAFLEALDQLAVKYKHELGIQESSGYRTGGDYGPEQDWSKDRLGQALLHQASGAGPSDLQDRLLAAQTSFDALSKQYEDGQSHPVLTPLQQREHATAQAVEDASQETGQSATKIPGLDEKTQRELSRAQDSARKEAENILMRPQLEEIKNRNRALIQDEKERATGEISNQVGNEPVFRAYALFNPEGADPTISQKAIWKKSVDYMNGRLSEEDALHFETVSEMSGFGSADEMAQKLLTTERGPAFQAEVKKRVGEHMAQFADLKDTAAMKTEALRAVHNEKSGEFIALSGQVLEAMSRSKEINAGEASQRRDEASARWEQAKQLARDTIAAKPVETAGRFRPYYTAERDAAVREQKAIDAGKMDEAAQANSERLHNHALAAESLRVRDRIYDTKNQINKQRGSDIHAWKDQDNFFQAADIMRRFGFDRDDYDPSKRQENLSSWAERMADKVGDDAVAIPDWLKDESVSKDWSKLKPGELEDVKNSLANIRHLGNIENDLQAIDRGRQKAEFVGDLVAEATKNVRGGHTPGADPRADLGEKMWNLTEKWGNVSYAVETILSKFDGWKLGGKWGRIVEAKSSAQDNEATRKGADADWWKETNKVYTPKELVDLDGKKVFIPEINDSLSKRAMMVAIANTGTESNQRVLMEGRGWNEKQIEAIKGKMDKRDFDVMQALLDRHEESNKPALTEMAKRRSGFEPTWIQAKKISTPFGEYDGGYLPLRRDNRVSSIGMQESILDDAPMTYKAATEDGMLKERNSHASYPVSLDINDQLAALNKVSHYLTMQDWVSDMNSLMNDPDIKKTIIDTSGKDRLNTINNWVKDVAGNNGQTKKFMDGAVQTLTNHSVISQLGTKLSVTVATGTHGIFAVGGVDPENFGPMKVYGGLLNFMWNMAKDPLNHYQDSRDFMLENSKYMDQHAKESEASITEAADKMAGKNRFGNAVKEFAFSAMHGLYNLTITPIWNDAYKTGLILKEGDHDAATQYANMIVRNSSPPGRTSDIPSIMHDTSVGKLLFLMHGFADRQYQMMIRAGGRFGVQARNAGSAADIAKATSQYLGTYANVLVIPGMAMAGLKMIGSRDDEREHKIMQKHMVRSLSPLTTYPVISWMQDMAIDAGFGVRGNTSISPVGAAFDSYDHFVKQTASARSATEQKMEAGAKLASFALPYPQAINDAAFNLADIIFHGMQPRASDAIKRRPFSERGED